MLKVEKLDETVNALVSWIQEQVKEAGATGGVFGLSGGADSALVAILTKRAFPDNATGVIMPCHSSVSSSNRATELAASIDLHTVTVNLSSAHEVITSQVSHQVGVVNGDVKMANAGLRSCLRAPTLDFVAKLKNALIIGTGNRDEDELARYYQKRGDGAVDISPIAMLHKSEVYQLLRHLKCPQSIIDATPTADLWGPDSGQADEQELGLSYTEMEWAIKENDETSIVTGDYISGVRVLDYTPRQLDIVRKLRKMEHASKHKAYPPPVFDVRYDQADLFEDTAN